MTDSTSKIALVGDPHGRYVEILDGIERERPAAAILLGDLDLPAPLEDVFASVLEHTEVWWIAGNHEGDSEAWYARAFDSALADRCLHGRVVEIAGLRVAGLSGVFREKVWWPGRPPAFRSRAELAARTPRQDRFRGGPHRRHHVTIFPEDLEAFEGLQADMLVTHEAPSCHPHGFLVIDELALQLGVRLVVHGHHHQAYRATLPGGVEVIGLGEADLRMYRLGRKSAKKTPSARISMSVTFKSSLENFARKYIWWQPPGEALKRPERVIAQVMDIGDWDDVLALEALVGDDALREALRHAEAGWFSERSWNFWHYRLNMAELGRVPPLPRR